MSSAMADAADSKIRKRSWKANTDDVDGTRIKAAKLSYEKSKGNKSGKVGLFEKLRMDLLGQRSTEKLKGRDLDIQVDNSLPVEKMMIPHILRTTASVVGTEEHDSSEDSG